MYSFLWSLTVSPHVAQAHTHEMGFAERGLFQGCVLNVFDIKKKKKPKAFETEMFFRQ